MSAKSPKRKRVSVDAAVVTTPMSSADIDATAVIPGDAAAPAQPLPAQADEAVDSTAVLEAAGGFPADPIVALPSSSTVKDASALKAELMKVLNLSVDVALDVRSVERVDTATMQLLCAFVRDRAARNAGVQWLGTPSAILDAARLLGVQAMLSLPNGGAA